jgi:hypothetical protein
MKMTKCLIVLLRNRARVSIVLIIAYETMTGGGKPDIDLILLPEYKPRSQRRKISPFIG